MGNVWRLIWARDEDLGGAAGNEDGAEGVATVIGFAVAVSIVILEHSGAG